MSKELHILTSILNIKWTERSNALLRLQPNLETGLEKTKTSKQQKTISKPFEFHLLFTQKCI